LASIKPLHSPAIDTKGFFSLGAKTYGHWELISKLRIAIIASHLGRHPIALSAIEGLRKELHVGVVSRLWALDLHRASELNPRHR